MSITFRESAEICCSVETAFRLYTDSNSTTTRIPNLVAFEPLNFTPEPVGRQNRLIFDCYGSELEAVETIVSAEPPSSVASQCEFRQFLFRTQRFPGEMVPTVSDLENKFRLMFGYRNASELTLATFEPVSSNRCIVRLEVSIDIGGLTWLSLQVQRLFRRQPLRAALENFRHLVKGEAEEAIAAPSF